MVQFLSQPDHFLRCVFHSLGDGEIESGLAQNFLAQFHVRTFQAHHDRNLDAEAASRGHHATGHDVNRKSTRLNSSHITISYAVFCLKKKKKKKQKLTKK